MKNLAIASKLIKTTRLKKSYNKKIVVNTLLQLESKGGTQIIKTDTLTCKKFELHIKNMQLFKDFKNNIKTSIKDAFNRAYGNLQHVREFNKLAKKANKATYPISTNFDCLVNTDKGVLSFNFKLNKTNLCIINQRFMTEFEGDVNMFIPESM